MLKSEPHICFGIRQDQQHYPYLAYRKTVGRYMYLSSTFLHGSVEDTGQVTTWGWEGLRQDMLTLSTLPK